MVAECFTWDQNNNLFELKKIRKNEPGIYLSNKNSDKWKLWHHRLGHLSYENMKKIKAEDVEFNEFCEDFNLEKFTKKSHKTVDKINKDPNYHVINSDIVGPMKTQSLGFKKHILTYLCGLTENSFVYLL